MTYFHLIRTQKHKILSIVVLNMAKFTIISFLLIDFVSILFIFNSFRRIFRESFRFKKIPSSKKSQVDFRGVVNPFQKSPKFKIVPKGGGGRRGSSPLWTNCQVSPLFRLESFPYWPCLFGREWQLKRQIRKRLLQKFKFVSRGWELRGSCSVYRFN